MGRIGEEMRGRETVTHTPVQRDEGGGEGVAVSYTITSLAEFCTQGHPTHNFYASLHGAVSACKNFK